MKRCAIFAFLTLSTPFFLLADQQQDSSWFYGIGLNSDEINESLGDSLNLGGNRAIGYSLNLGYSFNQNFKAMAGYKQFGKVSPTVNSSDISFDLCYRGLALPYCPDIDLDIDVSSVFLKGRGQHSLTDKFAVFFDISFNRWNAKVTAQSDFGSSSASDSGTDIGFGAGTAYQTGKHEFTLSYEKYDFDGSDINSISLQYNSAF